MSMWTEATDYNYKPDEFFKWRHKNIFEAELWRVAEKTRDGEPTGAKHYYFCFEGEEEQLVNTDDEGAKYESLLLLRDKLEERQEETVESLKALGCTSDVDGHRAMSVRVAGKRDSFLVACSCGQEEYVAQWYAEPLEGWRTDGWSKMMEAGLALIEAFYGPEHEP